MSKQQIKQSILKALEQEPNKNEIKKISLFGSHLHGDAKPNSDVDLLIEFEPRAVVGFFKFFDIRDNLAKYLKKKIDLLTAEDLSQYFRDDVLRQAEIIYER